MAWLTFDRKNFEVIRGTPHRFASSTGVVRTFCADCGTPLTYASDKTPSTIDITTISFDEASLFPPTQEEWVSHKLEWEAIDATRTQYPGDPPE